MAMQQQQATVDAALDGLHALVRAACEAATGNNSSEQQCAACIEALRVTLLPAVFEARAKGG